MYESTRTECAALEKKLRDLAGNISTNEVKDLTLYHAFIKAANDLKSVSGIIAAYFDK